MTTASRGILLHAQQSWERTSGQWRKSLETLRILMNVSDNIQDTGERKRTKWRGKRPLPHSYSHIQTSAESKNLVSRPNPCHLESANRNSTISVYHAMSKHNNYNNKKDKDNCLKQHTGTITYLNSKSQNKVCSRQRTKRYNNWWTEPNALLFFFNKYNFHFIMTLIPSIEKTNYC